MMKPLTQALRALFVVVVIGSVLFPAITYLIGDTVFHDSANGSVLRKEQAVIGSQLIGQYNDHPTYFWPRPSMGGYQPKRASASNFPYMSDAYKMAINERYKAVRQAHPDVTGNIPIDIITSSASGLDPHISPEAAMLQVGRISKARKLDAAALQALVDQHTEEKQWGIFGARRVNVLLLNIALDEVN